MYQLSTAHGDKLRALQTNRKLPTEDRPILEKTTQRYEAWLQNLYAVEGDFQQKVAQLVEHLNSYKLHLDLDLIFDSSDDFLYRQKGQLKLDNSVIEEFLPIFITLVLQDELSELDLTFGPNRCFSNIYFGSNLASTSAGGGLNIREKDQDFVISRNLYLQASHRPDFADAVTKQTNIAYMAIECKTNLDKTMFQEASATALDMKTSVPAAKYYLLCEWLDMTPISSSVTAIDEVIILRKAKRLPSNIRNSFNTRAGRRQYREFYEDYLRSHPFHEDMFSRIAGHVLKLISSSPEDDALERGHF